MKFFLYPVTDETLSAMLSFAVHKFGLASLEASNELFRYLHAVVWTYVVQIMNKSGLICGSYW